MVTIAKRSIGMLCLGMSLSTTPTIAGAASPLTVSGTVTEMTVDGPVPVKAAYVEVCAFDSALTDARLGGETS